MACLREGVGVFVGVDKVPRLNLSFEAGRHLITLL